jgi:hypothetical protein
MQKYAELIDDLTNFENIAKITHLSTLMLREQGGPPVKLPWYSQIVVLLTGVFSIALFEKQRN